MKIGLTMSERTYLDYVLQLVQRDGSWFVLSIVHRKSGARLLEPGFDFMSEPHALAYAKGLVDAFLSSSPVRGPVAADAAF